MSAQPHPEIPSGASDVILRAALLGEAVTVLKATTHVEVDVYAGVTAQTGAGFPFAVRQVVAQWTMLRDGRWSLTDVEARGLYLTEGRILTRMPLERAWPITAPIPRGIERLARMSAPSSIMPAEPARGG